MSRRLLALACALAVLASAAPAVAATRPYVHEWVVEGQVGGDLGGATRKDVLKDEMTLALSQGAFIGHLRYVDAARDRGAVRPHDGADRFDRDDAHGQAARGRDGGRRDIRGEAQLVTRVIPSLDAVSRWRPTRRA